MKKQVIIALSLAMCSFSFAQKKELKAAEKAVKGNNFAEAKAAISQAESLMSAMDQKTKDKFYYLKGQALYANGAGELEDFDKAIESFDNVKSAYKNEITALKTNITNALLQKGNGLYEKKDFSGASKYFERAYNVSQKDTTYLYYAAATAVNVKEFDRALVLYEKLKNLGYTGVAKQYYATNKETGKEEIFDKQTRDFYVKAKSHINPGERTTESKKAEIVKNIALIYVSQGNNEKALTAMKDARAESPDDINLLLSEANVHFKMGNNAEFKRLLQKATEMDPKNPELQYNLGVIASDSGEDEEAKAYYEKAIELDPGYINAYINMSALVLGREEALIEEMNGLGTSDADDKRYEELRIERQNLYKDAVPYLTKALEISPKNLNAAKTLMNIYSILGETDKHNDMKEKVAAIEAGN